MNDIHWDIIKQSYLRITGANTFEIFLHENRHLLKTMDPTHFSILGQKCSDFSFNENLIKYQPSLWRLGKQKLHLTEDGEDWDQSS